MKRLPIPYLAGLLVIAAAALFLVLVAYGVVPIEGWVLYLYGNALLLVLMLAFAALGGAFVGMLVAQRILGGRQFTPLERSMVEAVASLHEIREQQAQVLKRLESLEERR